MNIGFPDPSRRSAFRYARDRFRGLLAYGSGLYRPAGFGYQCAPPQIARFDNEESVE
jgi:hypothetical protein